MNCGHISLLPLQGLPEIQRGRDSSSSARCVGSGLRYLQRICWTVEGANLNEKKRLRVCCQHSPCLLYSPFGFCFPLNSFMFPRIINSHFSTGQEVHSWAPPLPASLLCPCCPVTAAQTQTMPDGIHTGHVPGSVRPAAGHWEFIGFRQAHASQDEQRKGHNPAVSSRRP